MQTFPVHTIESAPEKAKPALRDLQQAFGMIPNIAGAMATSPVLISSLVGLFQKVHGGSFTEAQIQTLLLTNAVTNGCTWAVAFHTALALTEGLDPADVRAIRERRAPKDSKHAALSTLAKTLIEKRGSRRPSRTTPATSLSLRWRPPSRHMLGRTRECRREAQRRDFRIARSSKSAVFAAPVVPQRRRNLKMHGNSILITGGGPASAVAWRRLLESPMVDITQTFLAIYPSASDKIYWGRVAG